MQINFLGTGTSQGVPVITCECPVCKSVDFRDKRLRTAIHISVNGHSIFIDAGPDFRQQALRAKIAKLDTILFTHEHKDHTAGLDDIRAYFFAQGLKDIPVYATERVKAELKKAYGYIFQEKKYPGVPSIILESIEKDRDFYFKDQLIQPIEVMHGKLPIMGFKIENMAYITDANFIADDQKEKLRNLDVLIINALHHKKHHSHFTLEEALEVIEELSPKKAYLTHISHQMGKHIDVQKSLPDNVFIAFDGLILNI
ncbi:MBL fold metallo-hydrolase [Sediminitomix flava]|uniref:Phosphoribosyl 1,2-cyclic phosphate phosphodiesterase n=1 Tax=Sediminitomix flava TaxID=379075 RepID=A0A315Z7J6_SEDFL|nr:MBL fold metallo-hydrolase [Sediminitomix flava]PWJ40021.1 phosphoribosyl 1,2-cyclic phosphate phosphodiesterase [Sediminitomix flava]